MTVIVEEIIAAVSETLSWWPFGGECVGAHKNQWDEWIAECHMWGPRYDESGRQIGWCKKGDSNLPIRQFMVTINEFYSKRFGGLWIRLWDAKDEKREPTFIEEGGSLLDPDAPPSPYIVEPIKQYIKEHENDPLPF